MEYLPQDLTYEIVLRLPVRDLIRFSFVSKLWKAVICSKDFSKEHQQRRAINKSMNDFTLIRHRVSLGPSKDFDHFYAASFSGDTLEEERQFEHPLYYQQSKHTLWTSTKIVTVCHGLVLLDIRNYASDLFLWNPVIGKHRFVLHRQSNESIFPRWTCGLGYNSNEDDIEVLVVRQRKGKSEFIVYSVASGRWRRITKLPPSNLQIYENDMVPLSDSRVAWLMTDVEHEYHVVTFDLVKEEYNTLRLPISNARGTSLELIELGGFLWVIMHERMWLLQDSSCSTEPVLLNKSVRPLFFDGERLLLSRFSHYNKELYWYNIKTGEHQHVTKTGHDYARFNYRTQTAFICGGNLRFLLDDKSDQDACYWQEVDKSSAFRNLQTAQR